METPPKTMQEIADLHETLPPFSWAEIEAAMLHFAANETSHSLIATQLQGIRSKPQMSHRELLLSIFTVAIAIATPASSPRVS